MLPVQNLISTDIFSTGSPDSDVINEVIDFLRPRGCKVFLAKDRYSPFDLYVIAPSGIDYIVEVKGHPQYKSTSFQDHVMETNKFNAMVKIAPQSRCVLISTYSDRKMKVSNFTDSFKIEDKIAGKTTAFWNKAKVTKHFVEFDSYKLYDL